RFPIVRSRSPRKRAAHTPRSRSCVTPPMPLQVRGWPPAVATSKPFPLIGPFVVFPLLAAAIAAAFPAGRAALMSIPMPVSIGVNAGRLLAVQFLILEAQGRLGGPFPFFAGWGDIITAMFALPVAWLAATTGTKYWPVIAAWNLFGMADLVDAI